MNRFVSILGALLCTALCGCGGGDGNNNSINNPPNNSSPVTVTPTTATNAPGQPTVFTLAVQSGTVPANPVVLNVTGLPANATAIFNPPQIPIVNNTLNGTSSLTITTNTSTPAGTYPLTIQGTVGTAVFGTAQLTLNVQPIGSGQQDFNLTVTPSTGTVGQGATAAFTATITTAGGFTEPITLTVNGQNGNYLVGNPSPSVLNLNGQTSASSSFVVSQSAGASGTSPLVLTITASGGGITKTATVTVQSL